ncbi:MAG: translation initiation factor IF-3 [Candidatus Melainabacteria bacterium]|jgi:translation initiation factor IF-3|nr:translation initiation factor IF-3 [Candidatus Melainabacteria bacterium]
MAGKGNYRGKRPRIYIPLNENIRARRLRVIDEGGENLGELSKEDALEKARAVDLDLFVVSDKTDVPIAKIADYGKYKFEQNKREKGQKKKQTGGDSKEIKMRYNIDVGDYNTRVSHARTFLEKQKRVKLNITLRGREIQHTSLAKGLAHRFLDDLMDVGVADGVPDKMTGRSIIVYIIPGPDKVRIRKRDALLAKEEMGEEQNVEDNAELQNS